MYKIYFLFNDFGKVNEFKKYLNRLNYFRSMSKKVYFCKYFDLCKGNLKVIWKFIGILIKRKIKGQIILLRIVRNNKIYINNDDIVDQFNKYFVNVGLYLVSKIVNSNVNFIYYILFFLISSFVMFIVIEIQVFFLFEILDVNKLLIDIFNKFIKLVVGLLLVFFIKIYN